MYSILWFGIGIFFLITYGVYKKYTFISIGLSGIYTAIFAGMGVEKIYQLGSFAVLTLLFYIGARFYLKGSVTKSSEGNSI